MNEQDDGRVDQMVADLRTAGHRLTPQRMAIVRLLVADRNHPSIDEIYQQVHTVYPMVSLATIYNTVQTLKEMGAVLELPYAHGNRYDGVHPYPHPHLVCTRCGRIEDLDAPTLSREIARVVSETGYQKATPRMEIMGICPRCQADTDVMEHKQETAHHSKERDTGE